MDKKDQKKQIWVKAVALTSLGWQLALSIFGGVFVGYHLDRWIGTRYIFTLLFLFLGILAGYYNLYKYINVEMMQIKKEKNKKENQEK